MKNFLTIIPLVFLIASCNQNAKLSDAYGNFEATETTISSEEAGRLVFLNIEEGGVYPKDTLIGLVDTTQLHLNLLQLKATRKATATKTGNIASQIDVLEEQKKNAQRELDRFTKMAKDGAATPKQIDDLKGSVEVLDRQINAIRTQNDPVIGELNVVDAQVAQVENRIKKCYIHTPVSGTILVKSAETGEIVAPGKPLFRIANLENIYLRVYVSGEQLPNLRLGQNVTVLVDKDEKSNRQLAGQIIWISSKAEFTPKIVQTKEERTSLVYAIKVKVKNDGTLKIGMPGEVNFSGGNNSTK